MGFASAFATGLVKGFHQNILREQAKRDKDDEKVEGYKTLLMKAVLSGDDINISGVNAVKDLIKSSEKQIAERGPIDIFGRPSEKLKMDTLDMAGMVNKVGNVFNLGGVKMPVRKSFYDKTIIKSPSARGTVFLDSLRDLGENKVRALFNTPESKEALGKYYMETVTNVLRPKVLSKDGNNIVQIVGPDSIDINKWMKTIVSTDDSKYRMTSGKLLKDGLMKQGDYVLPIEGSKASVIKKDEIGLYLNQAEQKTLQGLARLHGFPNTNEYLFEAASQYSDKESFFGSLKDTLKLFSMNAHEPRSKAQEIAIGKWIVSQEGNTANPKNYATDPIAASYLMLPLVVNKDYRALDWLRSRGFKYGTKGGFDEKLKQFSGYNFAQLEGDYKALERTDGQLTELINNLKTAGDPDAPLEKGLMFFNRIVGETGYVDRLSKLLGVSADSDDPESRAIYKRIESNIKNLDVTSVLAKTRTLKFIIAADLARAEDPSGRLSDQDLARNLAKLGGDFGTIKDSIAAIRGLQDDIRQKLRGKEVLYNIATQARGRNYFTTRDRMRLQADYMARKYISSYYRSIGGKPAEQIGETATEMKLEDLSAVDANGQRMFEFDPAYVTATGGQVYVNFDDTDNPTYVTVERFEKNNQGMNVPMEKPVIRRYTGQEFQQLINNGSITVKAAQEDISSAEEGQTTPMFPDTNVPSGTTQGQGTTTQPPPDQLPTVKIQDIGLNNISELGQPDSNGVYTVGNRKFVIVTVNPLTLREVN